jgi:hypothetical protein
MGPTGTNAAERGGTSPCWTNRRERADAALYRRDARGAAVELDGVRRAPGRGRAAQDRLDLPWGAGRASRSAGDDTRHARSTDDDTCHARAADRRGDGREKARRLHGRLELCIAQFSTV